MEFGTSALDWEQLDMIADGYTPGFMAIFGEFLTEVPRLLTIAEKCLAEGEIEKLGKIAHQLKGSAGNFGFTGVALAMLLLEHCCRDGMLQDAPLHLAEAQARFLQGREEFVQRHGPIA